VSGNNPATASVSVTTTARSLVLPSSRAPPPFPGLELRLALPWLFLLLTLALLALSLQWHPDLRRRVWTGLGTIVVFAMLLVGCGGGSSNSPLQRGTQAGSCSITITATSGSLSHSMTLHLTVQ
jgi:hypothetical protein